MTSRRRRILTSDEQALWSHVTRHIEPLGRRAPSPVEPEAAPSAPPAPTPPPRSVETPLPVTRPVPPPPPPLVPLERRLRQRLSRGSHPIDAVIDLHGMRQAEAHASLTGFLHRCQVQGHAVVLVVTGKGADAAKEAGFFEERGVLRRMVPHWLRLPDLRGVVVGFEEAARHHGGGGALYVRLRRRRSLEGSP